MPYKEVTVIYLTEKTEDDGEHAADHYLVVEKPEVVSTWHLRVKGTDGQPDHTLMGAAWASLHGGYRGNKYEGPNREEALSQLKALYKSEGMETPKEETKASEVLSEVKDGLVLVAVAHTGKFERDGKKFNITENDLRQMQEQLRHREVPLDYEHLSAAPNSPPGHSRASGWLKSPGKIEDFTGGEKVLWAWAEFTPACLASIRAKEYKYFSPEIHWNDEDEKGKPIGTRLAAGAITNRPFLKGLPPIEIGATDYPTLLEAVALSEHKRLIDIGSVHVSHDVTKDQLNKEDHLKTLKMKKVPDGEHKGKTGIFDGEDMVGLADDASLKSCAPADESMAELAELKKTAALTAADKSELEGLRKMKAKAEEDMAELAEFRKLKAKTKAGKLKIVEDAQADGAGNADEDEDEDTKEAKAEMTELSEKLGIRFERVDLRELKDQKAEVVCLTEFAKAAPGDATMTLAETLMAKNKLTMPGYLRAQKIERLIDGAIKKGKLLPKQRQPMYELAIANYDAVAAFLNEAKAVIDLKSHGIEGTGAEGSNATDELNAAVTAFMTERKVSYTEALRMVTAKNPELWTRHQKSTQILAESSAEGR